MRLAATTHQAMRSRLFPPPGLSRVADGSLPMEEAKRRNTQHYERFYGKPMPKKMLF